MFDIANRLIAKYATVPTSPAPTYTVHRNADAPCTTCDIAKVWTTDIAQLQVLCNADPGCVGFVSTGYLKNSTKTFTYSAISDLYVKNT